jgi:tetratricopeptide (TPR) repeat protein
MIFWPDALSAAYEPTIHQSVDATVIAAILLLSGICAVSVRLFKANRLVGFWIAVFFIGLLPVSQIIPLITLMNDRYLYFPMLGVGALAGLAATALLEKLLPRYTIPFYTTLALLLILLSAASFQRVALWHDDISLGLDTIAKSPNQYAIWEGLGEAYYFTEPQQQTEALKAFARALELAPTSKLTLYNAGVLRLEMGDYDSSYDLLKRLVYYHNDHAMGWACLGDIYVYKKNYPEAEKAYRQALTLKPETERAILGMRNLEAIQSRFYTPRY